MGETYKFSGESLTCKLSSRTFKLSYKIKIQKNGHGIPGFVEFFMENTQRPFRDTQIIRRVNSEYTQRHSESTQQILQYNTRRTPREHSETPANNYKTVTILQMNNKNKTLREHSETLREDSETPREHKEGHLENTQHIARERILGLKKFTHIS